MPAIRPMTPDDLPFALRLSTQAGWNQTPADWQRFLALSPLGCFVAEHDDGPIGTVCVFPFADVAWIAMLLVDEASRGNRFGTALLRHAIEHAESLDAKAIRLDATPMGERLYERFGFRMQYRLTRYYGRPSPLGDRPPTPLAILPAESDDMDAIIATDMRTTWTRRDALLRSLMAQSGVTADVAVRGNPLGFAITRPGRLAAFVGPCACIGDRDGQALLAHALNRHLGRPVMLDIPDDNAPAIAVARQAGLEPQRQLTRMVRGHHPPDGVQFLFASSGPEKG